MDLAKTKAGLRRRLQELEAANQSDLVVIAVEKMEDAGLAEACLDRSIRNSNRRILIVATGVPKADPMWDLA